MKKLEFDGVIFDFDGVIMDTEKYHYLAWKEAFKEITYDFSEEEYYPLRSTGRTYIINYIQEKLGIILSKEQIDIMLNIKSNVFDKEIKKLSKNDLIKGVRNFLDYLYDKKVPMAVASSSKTVKNLLNIYDLDKYFKVVLDGNTSFKKKPAPDIFLEAKRLLGLEKPLVFEDSKVGVEAAISANMTCVAIGGLKAEEAALELKDFEKILLYI